MRLTPVLEASAALHAALVADGWEGTVAKRTTGRYRCGHRSASWVKLKSPAPRPRHHARDAAPPGPAARVPPVSDRPRTPCPTCGQAIKPDETDVVDAVEIGLLGPTFGGPSEPAEVRHAAFHPSCFSEGDPAWRRK